MIRNPVSIGVTPVTVQPACCGPTIQIGRSDSKTHDPLRPSHESQPLIKERNIAGKHLDSLCTAAIIQPDRSKKIDCGTSGSSSETDLLEAVTLAERSPR